MELLHSVQEVPHTMAEFAQSSPSKLMEEIMPPPMEVEEELAALHPKPKMKPWREEPPDAEDQMEAIARQMQQERQDVMEQLSTMQSMQNANAQQEMMQLAAMGKEMRRMLADMRERELKQQALASLREHHPSG